MVELAEPVQALQDISHDPSLQTQVLVNGRGWMTAIDIQRIYQQAAQAYIDRYHIDDQQTVDVVNAWAQVLDLLEHNPAKLADRLDWIAKYQLLNGMRERHGLDWSNAKLGMLDLQWQIYGKTKVLPHPGCPRCDAHHCKQRANTTCHQLSADYYQSWARGR